MFKWLILLFSWVLAIIRAQRELALENLLLRQQLAVYKAQYQRPRLTDADRWFWIIISRIWKGWRERLVVVKPETVIHWHRQGFKYYWTWKSRRRRGRPALAREIRDLIRQMSRSNPLWGAPRIHGELIKLGIDVSQATVSKYIARHGKPPSQGWRTFLENHTRDLISVDFFTVPSATFRVLYVFVVLSHARRQIVHVNVTAHPTAAWTARQLLEACGEGYSSRYLIRDRDGSYGDRFRQQALALGIEEVLAAPRSPWQNVYAERVIGSIRRECLNYVVILNGRHLLRILKRYVHYYNATRTHPSLDKDSPAGRPIYPPEHGRVVEVPRVGGLHHEYIRMAA